MKVFDENNDKYDEIPIHLNNNLKEQNVFEIYNRDTNTLYALSFVKEGRK
ncbi:hypothetical protein Saga11_19960 [Bacillus safensis]|nr:hypothetical protein Saga11_19960 [Bacillus safensis]